MPMQVETPTPRQQQDTDTGPALNAPANIGNDRDDPDHNQMDGPWPIELADHGRMRSRSPHNTTSRVDGRLSEGIPARMPPRTHSESAEIRRTLMALQSHGSTRAQGPRPRLGRGEINIASSANTLARQACAASSVIQLLCEEYNRPYHSEAAADLALEIQRMTWVPNGTALDISDVWWKALTHFLPEGPWPGLLIVHAPRGRIDLGRSCILRLAGPIDDRIFCVLADGYHFDPIWWPTPLGIKAVAEALSPAAAQIEPTLTPNMGPGAGALLIWGATYVGCTPYANQGNGNLTRNQAASTIEQRTNAHRGGQIDVNQALTIITLDCDHPSPPYPEFCSRALGVQMLAPSVRLIPPTDLTIETGLLALAFDHLGCHIGTVQPSAASDALTRLHTPPATVMPRGHPSP